MDSMTHFHVDEEIAQFFLKTTVNTIQENRFAVPFTIHHKKNPRCAMTIS
ncbi:hypothetical protein CFter6_1975 [Collimonas fungivorans]|uniref:Uncharacterized protein n=1 Tax=Collimonas fungivorans TaxID=158899 RepID=A0A127PA90_9BURK|nr:hypothetical protein CFter6_1975 [Collimonas fungivorans]